MSNEEAVKMLRTMQRTVYLGNRKFEDAIECAIKALSEPLQPWETLAAQSVLPQPEPHWISCKKELPKLDSRCVLLYSNDNISGGYYRGNRTFDVDYGDEDVNTMVIAWMPAPQPFKGVTE